MNRRIAFLVGLLAGFHGAFLMIEEEILGESLTVFLVVIGLFFLSKLNEKSKLSLVFGAGIVFGLSCLIRPNVMISLPFICIWLWTVSSKKARILEKLKIPLFFLIGSAICIFPVTLRNCIKGKEFVLISSHGGINFFIGNNLESDGHTASAPIRVQYGEHYEDNVLLASEIVAEKIAGKQLTPSEVSRFWYKEAFDYIKNNTVDWIVLELKKLALTLNAIEITNFRDIYFLAETPSSILKITLHSTIVVFPFGVIGLIHGWKNKRNLGHLYAMVFSTIILIMLFFVTARYRSIMMPAFIIFSGLGMESFWESFRRKVPTKILMNFFILIIMVILGQLNIDHIREMHPASSYNLMGKLYIQKKDLKNAEKYLGMALKCDPDLPDPYGNVWVNFARVKFYLGKYEESLMAYKEAIKRDPFDSSIQKEMKTVSEKVQKVNSKSK